ncbi:hypothetical protein AB0I69_27880 [Streptomyces sp. NPDC050508]|uniref:hypothetical protein n=1 Tax=Streptomyces sp. NPDC050508 TaxID=3155405 RepID=UPI00343BC5FC
MFLDSGRIPVVSSIAYGKDGGVHHLAAGPAGTALASALDGTLVLPAGVGEAGPVPAAFVDMAVPHAGLRHLQHLGRRRELSGSPTAGSRGAGAG